MNFFINTDLANIASGIEHSQIKRLRMFKKFDTQAKIVTTFYRNDWTKGPGQFDVELDDVINIFDYFGGNQNDFYQENTPEILCQKNGYRIVSDLGVDRHEFGYLAQTNDGQQVLIRAQEHSRQVTSAVFSPLGNPVPTISQVYDTRGFLSSVYHLKPNGQVKKMDTINQAGEVFCTEIFKNKDSISAYRLKFRGQKLRFTDLRELHSYFFDCLNQDYGLDNLFVSDRYECTEGLSRMKTQAKKAVHIHNQFLSGYEADVMTGTLNYNYEYALNHSDEFDYLICPSKWEKDEINQRFDLGDKIHAIAGGYSQTDLERHPMSERNRNLVLMVARISPEKQLKHALEIIEKVKKRHPLVRLEIYGSVTNLDELKGINYLIKTKRLQNNVYLQGVIADLGSVYDKATALLLTSTSEGLPLTLLEGISHGVPEVSYDCRYGPRDVIQDQQTGYLLAQDDVEAAATSLEKILDDQDLAQELSDNAYRRADSFSEEKIFQAWKSMIK